MKNLITDMKYVISVLLLFVGISMIFIETEGQQTPEMFLVFKSLSFLLIYNAYKICPSKISLDTKLYHIVKLILHSIVILIFILFMAEFIVRYLTF